MSKNKLMPLLIPFIAAVVVICGLAISGKVAKTANINPTATKRAAQEQQVSETTQPPVKSKVTFVAVGDNLIHNTLIAAGKQDDGSLDYNNFYKDIKKYIEKADIAVINQETMLGGASFDYAGYPCFNTPWEVGEAAINAGFDVFTCATNHSMDIGVPGIEKEIEFFSKHPEVTHIGTYASEEEYNTITYFKKNDIKFALLNFTYGTNGIPIPEDKSYVIKMLTEENVRRDITEARKNADCVIVFPHWGTENSHDVNDQQKKYVKIFSELGVDLVIGTHPHVLQKVQWVKNEQTGKHMLVYYSIGNFISHQTSLNQMCGGMAELTIEKNGDTITITDPKLAPVIDYYTRKGDGYSFSVYKLSDYNDDLAAKQAQDGATVNYFTNLSKKVVGEKFLDLE